MAAIRNYIGHICDHCIATIDSLVFRFAEDEKASKKIEIALEELRTRFFSNPTHFTFSPSVNQDLIDSNLKEDVDEFLEILKGQSEMFPFPQQHVDGAGRAYQAVTEEERTEMKSSICNCVATKINAIILELQTERLALAEQAESIRAAKKLAHDRVQAEKKLWALNILKTNSKRLKTMTQFQNDPDLILELLSHNIFALEFASASLKNDGAFILEALRRTNPLVLHHISEDLKNDENFMLSAISLDCSSLEYASENLKNNSNVVLSAIRKSPTPLVSASQSLKSNKTFMLKAIEKNKHAFRYAEENLKNDKDVVLAAVTAYGFNLQFASEALKNDKDVVLKAIRQESSSLKHASDTLKNNLDFILEVAKFNKAVLYQVSSEMKKAVESMQLQKAY